MDLLAGNIEIRVSDQLYLKDPNGSELGKKIVSHSIALISQMGFEGFTFKKLAKELKSTESSIYRYFENKHRLLIYLSSWYWSWIEYRWIFAIQNIESPTEKLKKGIHLICCPQKEKATWGEIRLDLLEQLIISESPKAYLNKEVDEVNKLGSFKAYKRFVGQLSNLVTEINPGFSHPHTLISTFIEGAHHQIYFSEHLPSLTDLKQSNSNLEPFYTDMIFKTIA